MTGANVDPPHGRSSSGAKETPHGQIHAHPRRQLDAIPERDLVGRYPYALATYAELHASLGQLEEARAYLDRALTVQAAPAERALLERKRAALG